MNVFRGIGLLKSAHALRLLCVALICSWAGMASAQISLSLNLEYSTPSDADSGGNWTLVGKAPGTDGIAGLSVRISGIATQSAAGPTGTVNGSDTAGFSFYGPGSDTLDIDIFQFPLSNQTGSLEERFFYGVGSVANGAPNFTGAPMGSTPVGPLFSSLSGYSYMDPWGADGSDFLGESDWDIAVPLASGTFSPGSSPDFVGSATTGQVFTSIPNDIFLKGSTAGASVSLLTRSNLFSGPGNLGDYNLNGIVDAADYTLWLETLGQAAAPVFSGADGDGSGVIDDGDYDVWKMNFGNMNSVVGTGQTIPEPSAAILVIAACFLVFFPWRGTLSGRVFPAGKDNAASVYEYLGKNITTA